MSIESLFPKSTIVGRTVPKKTFAEQLDANAKMKEHFTRDVERIVWLAKLAPSTLNVADGRNVSEIAVFLVTVRATSCPADVFAFIDTWMPRHALFILQCGGEASLLISYKERLHGAGEKKFRIVRTYQSAWVEAEQLNISLQGLSMDTLYENLVRQVAAGVIATNTADLKADVAHTAEIDALKKQIAALERRETLECQPTKKFQLHQQVLELKLQLAELQK